MRAYTALSSSGVSVSAGVVTSATRSATGASVGGVLLCGVLSVRFVQRLRDQVQHEVSLGELFAGSERLIHRRSVRCILPIGKAVRSRFKAGFLYLLLGTFFLVGKIIFPQQFILPWDRNRTA